MTDKIQAEVVVLGAGPGGYTAAFRAADLGKKVVLIEREDSLGGVCLNVGCIPSKALLHAAKVIEESAEFSEHGVIFGAPKIDLLKLRAWKDSVIKRLTTGLKGLAKQRNVVVLKGVGQFAGTNEIAVQTENGVQSVMFEHAIIAVGSRPIQLPFLPQDPRIMDSTGALALPEIPKRLLVLGGGIIGMEMATVYQALGSKVTVVEMMDGILGGVDKDLAAPLLKRMQKKCERILLESKVTQVEAKADGLWVSVEGKQAFAKPERFDRILTAVGRVSNGNEINAAVAGVTVDSRGFIAVDHQQRTNIPHIFAIGDVVGNPMLAHKAIPQGKIAAEVIAGKKHGFEPKCIPSVAYTDPEVAWVGLTEQEATAHAVNYEKAVFPWMASGRSLSSGRDEGLTKLIFNKDTHRIIGAGIVGPNAGELIAAVGLAIEMGCDAQDIALTIHPHPTLSETIGLAAEVFERTITDLYLPK